MGDYGENIKNDANIREKIKIYSFIRDEGIYAYMLSLV